MPADPAAAKAPPRPGARGAHAAEDRGAVHIIHCELGPRDHPFIDYDRAAGVDAFVRQVCTASPMQIVSIQRCGVDGRFLVDFSRDLDVPKTRMFVFIGLPRATAEKRVAAGTRITGLPGQATLGIVKLLGMAQEIFADSTDPAAAEIDVKRWLGAWLQRPQPALGGQAPAQLLDTAAGLAMVERVLGALRSGAYQ